MKKLKCIFWPTQYVYSGPRFCPILWDSIGCSPPDSPVHEIFQARILECIAISSSRGSSWPKDWTWISCVYCIGRWILHPKQPNILQSLIKNVDSGDSLPEPKSSFSYSFSEWLWASHLTIMICRMVITIAPLFWAAFWGKCVKRDKVHSQSWTHIKCSLKVKVLVAQSCWLCCDHMDCSPPGFSVHGILQAVILEWVAHPSPRGSSLPRDWIQVSLAGRFFTIWATWEAQMLLNLLLFSGSKATYSSFTFGESATPTWYSASWDAMLALVFG